MKLASPLLLSILHVSSSYHLPISCITRKAPTSRNAKLVMAEDEKRQRLAQLFGEESAAKIAERTGATKAKPKEEEPPDIQMLIEGMQKLQWGQIRLIDVDMAPGPLECEVAPLLDESSLLCVRLDLPLGMLLEQEEGEGPTAGAMVVGELLDDGSARAGGVLVGDLLRATTAVSMQMSYPTWQLMMGGVGRPQLQKILFPTASEPFEKVMAALGSNSREQQGNGQVVLLIERPAAAGAAAAAE